ncbi:MAG: hypothetical protein JNK75_11770, partial [Betaproteobacteria bacterium]|nr:hypothetical protein [Betaproteobacteria bacterium]
MRWTVALFATLCCALSTAEAQSAKQYRIAWLVSTPSSVPSMKAAIASFQAELRKFGYVEGKNLTVTYKFADQGIDALGAHAKELAATKPDLILTDSSFAALAAKGATTRVPILMAVSAAPVQQGLAASLAKPGGNITGMTLMAPQTAEKRLELLKLAVPRIKRVA